MVKNAYYQRSLQSVEWEENETRTVPPSAARLGKPTV